MPDIPTNNLMQRLEYSASELKSIHPSWPDAFIEDYLSINNNSIDLANENDDRIDDTSGFQRRAYFYGRNY